MTLQQNRYERTTGTIADKILDGLFSVGPYLIGLFSFLIALSALGALIGIDVLTGKYTDAHMSNEQFGWFSSLATTGLLMGILGTGLYGIKHGWNKWWCIGIIAVALIPMGVDSYFDGMSVDIIRFGKFVDLTKYFATEPEEMHMHALFRLMIGVVSLIGEPLAASSIVIFPTIKEILKDVFTR